MRLATYSVPHLRSLKSLLLAGVASRDRCRKQLCGPLDGGSDDRSHGLQASHGGFPTDKLLQQHLTDIVASSNLPLGGGTATA